MKNTISRIVLFILLGLTLILKKTMAQEKFEFNLTFGTYMNDHFYKEYHYDERNWRFNENQLTYLISSNYKQYTDTLLLKEDDILRLKKFIQDHQLNRSIHKKLEKNYLKVDWKGNIKGQLHYQGISYTYEIIAKSDVILKKDKDASMLKQFEDLLYEMIEKYGDSKQP